MRWEWNSKEEYHNLHYIICVFLYVSLTCHLSPTQFDHVHWHIAICNARDSICDKSASLRIARPWVRWPDWPRLVAPTHDWMVRVAPAFGVLDGFFCFQFVGWRDWRCWIVGLPGVLWLVMKWHERNKLRSSWSNYMGVSKNRGTPKSSILIGFSIIDHPFWGETPIYMSWYGCSNVTVGSLRIASHFLPEWSETSLVEWAFYWCRDVSKKSGWIKLNQTWKVC